MLNGHHWRPVLLDNKYSENILIISLKAISNFWLGYVEVDEFKVGLRPVRLILDCFMYVFIADVWILWLSRTRKGKR